ncbi:unnamed protein product [Symbiodinium sp. CCMP2592]|nr:unnamed protein product [Symbiodinium sp. CCMP2592]
MKTRGEPSQLRRSNAAGSSGYGYEPATPTAPDEVSVLSPAVPEQALHEGFAAERGESSVPGPAVENDALIDWELLQYHLRTHLDIPGVFRSEPTMQFSWLGRRGGLDIAATVLQSYSPSSLPKNMKAESMLEFIRVPVQMDKMAAWLEAVGRNEVPCTPALLYHHCQKGFEGFSQCQQEYFYPTGLSYNLTKHVSEIVMLMCDALILARCFPTSVEDSLAPPSRRETVSQFLDQYFGYGWARWRCPFDYVPDYTRGEYSTSEFAVLTAQVDDFRVDDFFDVDDLWSWWLPINGTFIWAMYTPPDTDNGIRTVSFWKIVRSQQNGRYVHIGDNYVWQPADNSQFNPEYAEREVLKPNWCIQSIPGIQKSYMQIGKWTCNRIGVATPEFRKRKIFILEMTHEPGRHSQRRPSLTLIKAPWLDKF